MYAETLSRSKLVDQHSIPSHGAPWHRDVLSDIDARLDGDPGFPCLFSKNAYAKGLLKFIFVEGDTDSDIFYLSNCLIEYVELSRHWNGSLNTAYPLVIAFSLAAIHHASLEQYDAFGWNVLQRLHDLDPSPWPSDVGQDPDMAGWSMSLALGMSRSLAWVRVLIPGHQFIDVALWMGVALRPALYSLTLTEPPRRFRHPVTIPNA